MHKAGELVYSILKVFTWQRCLFADSIMQIGNKCKSSGGHFLGRKITLPAGNSIKI
jgi:hypothetical protein